MVDGENNHRAKYQNFCVVSTVNTARSIIICLFGKRMRVSDAHSRIEVIRNLYTRMQVIVTHSHGRF